MKAAWVYVSSFVIDIVSSFRPHFTCGHKLFDQEQLQQSSSTVHNVIQAHIQMPSLPGGTSSARSRS